MRERRVTYTMRAAAGVTLATLCGLASCGPKASDPPPVPQPVALESRDSSHSVGPDSVALGSTADSTTTTVAAVGDTSVYQRCMNQAYRNDEFSACGGQEIDRQEQALAKAWTLAKAYFAASVEEADEGMIQSLEALEQEQRAWKRYQEQACGWWWFGNGREGQVIHYPACQIEIIEARVLYLQQIYR